MFPLGLLATSVAFDLTAARGSKAAGQTAFGMLGSGRPGWAANSLTGKPASEAAQ